MSDQSFSTRKRVARSSSTLATSGLPMASHCPLLPLTSPYRRNRDGGRLIAPRYPARSVSSRYWTRRVCSRDPHAALAPRFPLPSPVEAIPDHHHHHHDKPPQPCSAPPFPRSCQWRCSAHTLFNLWVPANAKNAWRLVRSINGPSEPAPPPKHGSTFVLGKRGGKGLSAVLASLPGSGRHGATTHREMFPLAGIMKSR